MPQIVEELAAEVIRGDTSGSLHELAGRHALLRYRGGYNLRQVLLEYQVLRHTIQVLHARYEKDHATNLQRFAVLDQFVDAAIGDAVEQYTDVHDHTRDVFVAALGHDLRNPLQAILSAATLIARGGPDPAKSAALIERSARRMDRLISDLLDFARARLGGEIPIARADHDLRPVVQRVVEEVVAANPDRSITCLADRAPGDFRGEFDADRVAQAVSNLASNAVQHGEDPIVVELVDEGAKVAVAVRSRGSIPADVRPGLFKPFQSGGDSKGLGLGLYVVHEIARAHGGDVVVTSDGGETAFRLVLPRRPL
jgi:signal transduction histidine kinase